MKYIVLMLLCFGAISCENSDSKTKAEVAEEYPKEVSTDDVYVVDTAGENVVKDTLTTIVRSAKSKEDK